MDIVYVVVDLYELEVNIVTGTTELDLANMFCASAQEGHSRYYEKYENGVKVGEGGFREESK